jgi:2-oxo-4-hydroxy-4-carboxy-5-ureidoimidazoline decarboxylase
MSDEQGLGLDRLNTADPAALRATLRDCCASDAWVDELLARRPFAGADAALDASDAAIAAVDGAAIDDALSGHPRIGDRAEGQGTDAKWSRQEQASVADADADVQTRLRAGNVAYEERFDRVFLIRAAGRSPQEMLAELTRRLDNDEDTERSEVREQLRQITRLRLERLLS